MALHHELPIYKVAYDLLGVAVDLVKNMPRDFKQSIGTEIRSECVRMMVLIFRANRAKVKGPHLEELLERLQVTELLLRVSRDKHFISTRQYAAAIEITAQIGKQANGWKKHASATSPAA